MASPFEFRRRASRRRLGLVLLGVWGTLTAAYLFLDAAPWVLIPFALLSLPALIDFLRLPRYALTLDDTALRWSSGRIAGEVPLAELSHMRLDTRLDFTVRASAVLVTGRKVRLPYEVTPPHKQFEEVLQDHRIKVERHHFTLMQ